MNTSLRRIYVIEAGWVLTGFEKSRNFDELHITDAACIRRWGTTDGLGQLALHGPTSDTVLDLCGEVHINPKHIRFCIKCPGWK